eukprot:s3444_g11.t1
MAALITPAALEALASIADVREWVGLPAATWAAVDAQLGGANHLRVLAYLSSRVWQEALRSTRVPVPAQGEPDTDGYVPAGQRVLTAVEGTQVGLMAQIAQMKLGRDPFDPLAEQPEGGGGTGGNAPVITPERNDASQGQPARKVKNNQVLDQADEGEVPKLAQSVVDEHFKVLKRIKGGPVRPEAEPSPDQISAMRVRVLHGVGIGTVAGPPNYDAWLASWRVYENTLLMLEHNVAKDTKEPVVTVAALEEYKDAFRDLTVLYPESWHLLVTAEDRCRAEHFVRLKRELDEKQQRGLAPDYDPSQPWNGVFRAAARDRDYWDRHVREPALIFRTAGRHKEQVGGTRSGTDLTQERPTPRKPRPSQKDRLKARIAQLTAGKAGEGEPGPPKGGNTAEGNRTKGRGPKRDNRGRFLTDKQGKPICFGFNNGECKGACPKQMAHDQRETQDEEYPGGMRNPRKAVQRAPGWQVWGAKASAALDEVLASSPQAMWLAERVGAEMRPEEVEAAQQALQELGIAGARAVASVTPKAVGWEQLGPTGWRWALVRAITEETNDLDVDISTWLQGKTPLGISESIVPRGIFPPAEQTKAQLESAEFLAMRGANVTVDRNYRSFHEHELESAYELERLTAEGHLEIIGTWEEVISRWPDARATKLATLVKEKPDGSTKTRFISDMRRSGINGMAQAEERITLPRGCDLVRDTLDLVDKCGGDIEYFTADFSDALLNLGITEGERGYAVVRTTTDAYAAYRGVPFGLATAPLLWGRASAWIGRATQSLHQEWESRLQIYVDDPVCLVTGPPQTRSHRIAKILTFWASLGARIALHKAARGPEIKWIGAVFGIIPGGVRVSVDKERIHKLQETVRHGLAETGLVHGVRSLAGELSWVAGIVPTIRPFTNMIWAATYAMERQDSRAKQGASKARIRPRDAVFAKMIRLPLLWLQRFLEGHHGGLQRERRVWDRTAFPQWYVRTDASTTGLGGILLDAKGRPVRWWASLIPTQALAHLKIDTGDPGLMTTYELLALLLSVIIWTPFLKHCRLGLMVQLDSESALYVAAKLASPHPKANLVAAELALRTEQLGIEAILGQHWPNYINTTADALSRLAEGKVIPPGLLHLPRDHLPSSTMFLLAHDTTDSRPATSAPKGGRVKVRVHVSPP